MTNTLGFGLGLRPAYYEDILTTPHNIDWFEAVTENFMVPGGPALHHLESIRARYPIVFHGVALGIGNSTALDMDYLNALKQLSHRFSPTWISDHLCWTGNERANLHDLLPLPYTEEALSHVSQRILQVQDHLARPLVIENPSTYLQFSGAAFSEASFLAELVARTGCKLLLDVNNIYVNHINHGFDANDYIETIPKQSVAYFHLAGHTQAETHIIDTHDEPVSEPVWQLYQNATRRFPGAATLLERDDNFPPFAELVTELNKARELSACQADVA